MYTDKSIHEILLPRRVTLYSLENNVFNFKVNNKLMKMYPIIHFFINCKVLAKKKITAEDNLLPCTFYEIWCNLPDVVYLTFGNRTQSIARNRRHFAPVINCQRNLTSKMADKNDRSQGKRIPRDFLNNLSSVDLFYEEKGWNKTPCKKMLGLY